MSSSNKLLLQNLPELDLSLALLVPNNRNTPPPGRKTDPPRHTFLRVHSSNHCLRGLTIGRREREKERERESERERERQREGTNRERKIKREGRSHNSAQLEVHISPHVRVSKAHISVRHRNEPIGIRWRQPLTAPTSVCCSSHRGKEKQKQKRACAIKSPQLQSACTASGSHHNLVVGNASGVTTRSCRTSLRVPSGAADNYHTSLSTSVWHPRLLPPRPLLEVCLCVIFTLRMRMIGLANPKSRTCPQMVQLALAEWS